MNNAKRGALRFALYLQCVGITPTNARQSYREQFAALLAQYQSLDILTKKMASRLGRQAIRNAHGLRQAAQGLIPSGVREPFVDKKRIAATIEQMPRKEIFQKTRSQWSRRTPPCPSCRMMADFLNALGLIAKWPKKYGSGSMTETCSVCMNVRYSSATGISAICQEHGAQQSHHLPNRPPCCPISK